MNAIGLKETPWPDGYKLLPAKRVHNVQMKARALVIGPDFLDWKAIYHQLEQDGYAGKVGLETHVFDGTLIESSPLYEEDPGAGESMMKPPGLPPMARNLMLGLMAVAILAGVALLVNRGSQVRLEGSILKVRVVPTDDNACLAVVDFRVKNPPRRSSR